MLIAVTFKKGCCGFERDGSYSTKKEDRWQMFDVAPPARHFVSPHMMPVSELLLWESGMKTVSQICCRFRKTRNLPLSSRSGHPDIDPDTPKRKSVSDLLTYL